MSEQRAPPSSWLGQYWRSAWLRNGQLGDDASPTQQRTVPSHLLHRYCDQLSKWETVGSYRRSDAPGRLGMPGKWDRNSNRGIDCLQGTG